MQIETISRITTEDAAFVRKVLVSAGIKANVKIGRNGFYMLVKTADPVKIYTAIETLAKVGVSFRGETWDGMHLNHQVWAFEIKEG
jgi:hypothetical protein